MSATVYKWRVYCNTENTWVYLWNENESLQPTTCPNDGGHDINHNSISIIDTISTNKISIKEESTPTGGNFRSEGHVIDAVANSVTTHIMSWQYPITVLLVLFNSSNNYIGDIINCIVGPNTTIGVLTENITTGTSTFTVSNTVLNIIKVGYSLKLSDGVNLDDLGCVVGINQAESSITTCNPTVNSFNIGTYILTEVYTIKDYEIDGELRYKIGEGKIGGSYLPANTLVHVKYNNTSPSTNKHFRFQIEYLY